MKITSELEAMFEIPEEHTPKVLISGGTNQKHFQKTFGDMVESDLVKEMDNDASKKGLPMSPVMILLVQHHDGHVHAIIHLPLQKWQDGMRIEPTVENSKDLRRITDWCAGFMEVFCMNDTITALDLTTNQTLLGDKDGTFAIESIIKDVRPKKDVRGTAGLDIGNADDILGQLSKPQIEKFQTKKKEPKKEKMNRVPVKEEPEVNLVDEAHKRMKSQQQEVVDKYGYQALEDLCKKLGKAILIDKPV